MICKFVFFLGEDLKVGLKFILREDQEPSRIEHLFLGYGDKWPRKWLGIGRDFANWSQCTANAVPIQFDMLGIDCHCRFRQFDNWSRIGLELALNCSGLAWIGKDWITGQCIP